MLALRPLNLVPTGENASSNTQGIGIGCSGQRPSAGTSKVIRRRQKKEGKKK